MAKVYKHPFVCTGTQLEGFCDFSPILVVAQICGAFLHH